MKAMVLRNHGLLACGRDCAEAFSLIYQLELAAACRWTCSPPMA